VFAIHLGFQDFQEEIMREKCKPINITLNAELGVTRE
jgi:hypothetical protein